MRGVRTLASYTTKTSRLRHSTSCKFRGLACDGPRAPLAPSGEDAGTPGVIRTEPGMGYRLNRPTRFVTSPARRGTRWLHTHTSTLLPRTFTEPYYGFLDVLGRRVSDPPPQMEQQPQFISSTEFETLLLLVIQINGFPVNRLSLITPQTPPVASCEQ